MRHFILTSVIFLTALICHGQKFSKEFGKIGKDEIHLKQYTLDKTANAVVLFDIGKSHFVRANDSYDVVFERTTRIKILAQPGIKWGKVEIPFYTEGGIYEKIYDIEACTYNYEDGKIKRTQLDVKQTFDEKINELWNVKKFAIPNVKVGSIVEYRYKINSQYKFNLRDWEFQWEIPVVYSEYQAKMIPFYEYTYLMQGASSFDYQTSYQETGPPRQFGSIKFHDMVHKYVMEKTPAFNDEEFITSKNDYIIKIDFQLSKIIYPSGMTKEIITTWEDMIKELNRHKDFGKYLKKAEKIGSKLIEAEKIKLDTDEEKFDYVIDYIKNKFNWNGNNGKYATESPNELFEKKVGNSADINLLAIGMLRAYGIEAYPVLISTRNHGKIKYDYPYSHFFNYVLVFAKIDGKGILSDATEIQNLNRRIPPRCINDKGLIVKPNNVDWIGLDCRIPSEIKTNLEIDLTSPKAINTNISNISTEYDAFYYRNNYTDDPETIKEKLKSKNYMIADSTIFIHNYPDNKKPYILNYACSFNPEVINDKMYISPFLSEVLSDNPLKQKKRSYSIDLTYPKIRRFNSKITIPKGYVADFIPDKIKLSNELFELNYDPRIDEDGIHVSLSYFLKRSVYSPDDYEKIKLLFDKIVESGNKKIVLTKKI